MSDGDVDINSESDDEEKQRIKTREKLPFHLMALEALRALKKRKGSTTSEIEKYVIVEYEFKTSVKGWLVNGLNKLVNEGLVTKAILKYQNMLNPWKGKQRTHLETGGKAANAPATANDDVEANQGEKSKKV